MSFSLYLPIPSWPREFWPHEYSSPSCVRKRVWYRPQDIDFIFTWSNIFRRVSGTNMYYTNRISTFTVSSSTGCLPSSFSGAASPSFGLSWYFLCFYSVKVPKPSYPCKPEPQPYTLSARVANIECLEPAAISKTISSANY